MNLKHNIKSHPPNVVKANEYMSSVCLNITLQNNTKKHTLQETHNIFFGSKKCKCNRFVNVCNVTELLLHFSARA